MYNFDHNLFVEEFVARKISTRLSRYRLEHSDEGSPKTERANDHCAVYDDELGSGTCPMFMQSMCTYLKAMLFKIRFEYHCVWDLFVAVADRLRTLSERGRY